MSKTKAITPFSDSEYTEVFSKFVDFSSKLINSNATPTGIRLSRVQEPHVLPLLSCRQLISEKTHIQTDYINMSGSTSPMTAAKHLRAAKGTSDFKIENPDQIAAIYEMSTQDEYLFNTGKISQRARQILLPKNKGFAEYVSTTPLFSAGLVAILNAHITEHNANVREQEKRRETPDKKIKRIGRGFLGYGGANPQNVGALAREAQSPLFFDAPQEDPSVKQALRIYHFGVPLNLPLNTMLNYKAWRTTRLIQHNGIIPTNQRTKTQEIEFYKSICRVICARARLAAECLHHNQSALPAEISFNPDLPRVHQGLLDVTLRDITWRRESADVISHKIAGHRFEDGSTLGFGDAAIQANSKAIERFL